MKFINRTKNTVSLSDINTTIPYLGDEVQEIDSDLIKKSNNFQYLVKNNLFEIVEIGTSRIESNLKKQQFSGIRENIPAEKDISTKEVQVRIKGHFYDAGGYAKVNRNIAFGLNDLGVNVSIDPMRTLNNDLNAEELQKLATLQKARSANSITIDSIIPTFGQESGGKYRILYTTIEAETIPSQFTDVAKMYNEVWVVSDFCKKVLEESGYTGKVLVFPDTIDLNLYSDKGEKYKFNPELNGFVFVSVFGWSYRKGYDVLLRSYLKEFSAEDNTTLLVVSRYQGDRNNKDKIRTEIEKYIKGCGKNNPARILRCSKVIPENQMASLYRACDAFVLFTRGEGFGLPYCESSVCGLPVISTNCSGQTMFLNKDNSYLLDIDKTEIIPEGTMQVHYWDNQRFPSLKSEQAIIAGGKLMRDVFENYSKAKKKNKKLKEFVEKNYNIKTVCEKMKNRLVEIQERIC